MLRLLLLLLLAAAWQFTPLSLSRHPSARPPASAPRWRDAAAGHISLAGSAQPGAEAGVGVFGEREGNSGSTSEEGRKEWWEGPRDVEQAASDHHVSSGNRRQGAASSPRALHGKAVQGQEGGPVARWPRWGPCGRWADGLDPGERAGEGDRVGKVDGEVVGEWEREEVDGVGGAGAERHRGEASVQRPDAALAVELGPSSSRPTTTSFQSTASPRRSRTPRWLSFGSCRRRLSGQGRWNGRENPVKTSNHPKV
ncbi:hypothetical protein OsI_04868 [Oryza sativa Indica Group]|uniref:Uncharacterized protein n=1 Tax=Oryza sativa subsp. indica TaxID=39946 RepID=A2WY62_ORYSI|nr:hypothetical protein OsI_04868 [Oryza sativa Indica Group]